jgi:hypothetical protein
MLTAEVIGIWIGAIGLVLTSIGLWLVARQLDQANDHQRWSNYNQLNLQYAELFGRIPDELDAKHCKTFDELKAESQRWIRSYFNLYTEEHWLYQEGYIPAAMWTERIDGGVSVNFKTYPVIVEGYEHWKALGSFTHPTEFTQLVDAKIQYLRPDIEKSRQHCLRRRTRPAR